MKRKTFLQKMAGAFLLAYPAHALLNCSSSDDGPNGNPNPNPSANCLQNGTNVAISSNHGHNLTVSAADINAGVDKTYNIAGGANHPHQVTVTAAQFNMLKSNNQISVISSVDDSHSHAITVSCA